MTTLCGGGPSGPKPSSPAFSYLAGNVLENVVESVFGVSEVWASLLVFTAAQTIDWGTFCASDPPAMPTLTGTEIFDILSSPWDISQPAWQHWLAIIQIALWHYGCQCTSVVTPAPPTWPAYPATAPVFNPAGSPVLSQGTCYELNNSVTFQDPGNNPVDLSPAFFPSNAKIAITPTSQNIPNAYVVPDGLIAFTETVTLNNPNNLANSGSIVMNFFTSAGADNGEITLIAGSSRTLSNISLNVPANTHSMQIVCADGSGTPTGPMTFTGDFQFTCATSAAPVQPCCPPDTSLQGTLQQILNFVSSIYATLPTKLNSLAESTVHAGLVGSGNFSVGASAIACRVTFVAPASYGMAVGDPTTTFDVGWLTTSAVEGNYRSTRLQHTPELILFEQLVDAVHYTLEPGVTATITELVRGP